MENRKKKQNLLEKITFYLGLIILFLLVGYLLFEFKTKQDLPPNLEITTAYQPSMSHYTYKVETTNKGHETATSVNIGFDLFQNGEIAEKAVLTLSYVPRDSKEEGWVVFRKTRNASDSLVITSVSFLKP